MSSALLSTWRIRRVLAWLLPVCTGFVVAANAAPPGTVGTTPATNRGQEHQFQTVGLYVSPATGREARAYDFYRACGYNYVEFCDWGFASRPDVLGRYYQGMAEAIDAAHQRGLKVGILLLAGMKQWEGPAESGNAGMFSALDATQLQTRLSLIRKAVQRLRRADGFVFFAGDPGGDPRGSATVHDCAEMARQVRRIVRDEAPLAEFTLNLWAIAEWGGFPSPMGLEFWNKQVSLSRAVTEEDRLLGPDLGVVFSLDNYYRSLALACYAEAGLVPPLFPRPTDVRRLHDRGVKQIWGWPYFLVDEIDDGFITPNNVASGGQSQAETRYIRAIIDRGFALGLNGLIANASDIGVRAEPLNIYVFGQMCRRPDLTPATALAEYASIVADDSTKGALARVLRFIENHSNWENSLPPPCRLKALDCGDVTSVLVAGDRLRAVVPRAQPPIPLPEPPAAYLRRLQKRLAAIAAGRIGGVNPIIRTKTNR